MDNLITNNILIILISCIFWLTPIILTIHLALERKATKAKKIKLGYMYGGLWSISVIFYILLFLASN